jgi:uncharacterized protein YggE
MKRTIMAVAFLLVAAETTAAQAPEVRFIADTLVVQAEGSYEADPDLATMTFDISSQDKELKKAYETAAASMQRIVALADKTGLKKEDVYTGVLTLAPSYERDRRNKAKSYLVQGQITLKVHDFAMIGPLLDGAAEEGIVEFRSMTYSLLDEEAAKERAVAEAMHCAVGRATVALAQNGQKVGAVRTASLDVKQLVGVTQIQVEQLIASEEIQSVAVSGNDRKTKAYTPPPPPPMPQVRPQKITVSASVQCAFEIK